LILCFIIYAVYKLHQIRPNNFIQRIRSSTATRLVPRLILPTAASISSPAPLPPPFPPRNVIYERPIMFVENEFWNFYTLFLHLIFYRRTSVTTHEHNDVGDQISEVESETSFFRTAMTTMRWYFVFFTLFQIYHVTFLYSFQTLIWFSSIMWWLVTTKKPLRLCLFHLK